MLQDGHRVLINVPADIYVLHQGDQPVIDRLGAADVDFEAVGLRHAGIGLHDLAFPVADGNKDVGHLGVNRLPGRGGLFAILMAHHFDDFCIPFDLLVEPDDFGMFGPQILAEFLALAFQQFNFLEGRQMVRRASHRRSRPQFLPAGGIGGGVGSPGGREALVKGGGVQELGLQFQVGKFGLQLGQIAAGNSSFLLQNGQVVGPFKSGQGILFALEFAFQAQHLFGNGGQRVARHGFADVLLVGEVFPQEGVQIGRRVSWIGARRLDDEDRAFRRLFDSDNHLERIAVLADGNGIAARLPQARHGPPAQLFAAEQLTHQYFRRKMKNLGRAEGVADGSK